MDSYESDDFIKEKVIFDCSIRNCQKNASYKIRISNEEKSLGEFPYIETKELKADHNNQELNFGTLNGIEYRFYQIQLFTIVIMKKNPLNNFYDNYKRQTIMASLVTSEDSIYERKLNEDDLDSEKVLIEVKLEENEEKLRNSENMEFFDSRILNFFKEGGKIKLLCFFDFFGKDNDIDYVKSQNIFYNLLVNFYNNCHLYTRGHEVYIFKADKANKYYNSIISTMKSSREDDFLYFDKFENIKNYFIKCLNKDLFENQIFSISPFIEKSLTEIEDNFFNVLIIFIRNLPEDIKKVLDKIEEIKDENKSISIILINAGNKFSGYLSNKIRECSNIILIENKDVSCEKLLKITQTCLNEIGKNIKEFKPIKQNNDDDSNNNAHETKNKNIFFSNNYKSSLNFFEENIEEKEEENMEENEKDNKKSLVNNSNLIKSSKNNDNINNNSINNNKEGKFVLKTSNAVINSSEKPHFYSQRINNINNNQKSNWNSHGSQYQYHSILESINESDSERNKKEEEINLSNKDINKEDNKYKYDESKMVDSKAKTDHTSLNNKMKSKYVLSSDD